MLAIRAAANKIIAENGSTFQVTRLWTQRWFKRNKKWFKTLRAKTLAQERKAAHRKEDLEEHFKEYYGALEKFGITILEEARNKADKDGKKYVQKYGVISKGAGAWQVAHRRETLYEKDELDNNAYLNRRVKETDAFIIKYITGKLPRQRKKPNETASFDCGELFRYSDLPPFLPEYGSIRLKEQHEKLTKKWAKRRTIWKVDSINDRWHVTN
jgi:hypothetical protein